MGGRALAEAVLCFRKMLSLPTVTSVPADLVLPSVSHTITLREGLGSCYGSSCIFVYFLCILTPLPFAYLQYQKQLLILFQSCVPKRGAVGTISSLLRVIQEGINRALEFDIGLIAASLSPLW